MKISDTLPMAGLAASLVALALACGGEGESQAQPAAGDDRPAPGAAGEPALLPMPQPDLAPLAPPVRTQIRERQLWQHRLHQTPDLQPEQRAAAMGELGNLYHAYGLAAAAEVAYVNAGRMAPEDVRWPYYLCELYRRTNAMEKAIASCRRAVALDPANVPARVRLAELLAFSNQPEEAEKHFLEVLTFDERCAAAHFGLGQLAASREDWEAAAASFEQVLQIQPQATAVNVLAAQAYRELGQTARAEASLTKKGDGEARLEEPLMAVVQGLSAGQQRFRQEAERAFRSNRFEEAAEAYRRAVAADPLYADLRIGLAATLLQLKDPAGALEQYELALKIAPSHPRANFGAAFLLQSSGDHARAGELYRRVLAAEPENRSARVNLAQTLLDMGDFEGSLTELETAVAADPSDPGLRLAQISALIAMQRYEDAIVALDDAVAANPQSPRLLQANARLLATSPRPEHRNGPRAVELAQELVSLERSPEHVETLAMALAAAGRFEDAVRFQEALVDAAAEAGRTQLRDNLARNLDRYRNGQPAEPPWLVPGARTAAGPGR